jgi:hypothetical protein
MLVQRAKEKERWKDLRRKAFFAHNVQWDFGGWATTGFILPRPNFLTGRTYLPWNNGLGGERSVATYASLRHNLRWTEALAILILGPKFWIKKYIEVLWTNFLI